MTDYGDEPFGDAVFDDERAVRDLASLVSSMEVYVGLDGTLWASGDEITALMVPLRPRPGPSGVWRADPRFDYVFRSERVALFPHLLKAGETWSLLAPMRFVMSPLLLGADEGTMFDALVVDGSVARVADVFSVRQAPLRSGSFPTPFQVPGSLLRSVSELVGSMGSCGFGVAGAEGKMALRAAGPFGSLVVSFPFESLGSLGEFVLPAPTMSGVCDLGELISAASSHRTVVFDLADGVCAVSGAEGFLVGEVQLDASFALSAALSLDVLASSEVRVEVAGPGRPVVLSADVQGGQCQVVIPSLRRT